MESRHVVDGASQSSHEPGGQRAGAHDGPLHACRSFWTGASRARLLDVVVLPCSSSFSCKPPNHLDNGHKHRNVATLPKFALLFPACMSLLLKIYIMLDVICSVL